MEYRTSTENIENIQQKTKTVKQRAKQSVCELCVGMGSSQAGIREKIAVANSPSTLFPSLLCITLHQIRRLTLHSFALLSCGTVCSAACTTLNFITLHNIGQKNSPSTLFSPVHYITNTSCYITRRKTYKIGKTKR